MKKVLILLAMAMFIAAAAHAGTVTMEDRTIDGDRIVVARDDGQPTMVWYPLLNSTGLVGENYATQVAYADSLDYGGYTDWRMGSLSEVQDPMRLYSQGVLMPPWPRYVSPTADYDMEARFDASVDNRPSGDIEWRGRTVDHYKYTSYENDAGDVTWYSEAVSDAGAATLSAWLVQDVVTQQTYRANQSVDEVYDTILKDLLPNTSGAYGSFSESRAEIIGSTLRAEKTGEVFTSAPDYSVTGIAEIIYFTELGIQQLGDALSGASDITEVMRFYIQIDNGGYDEYVYGADYDYDIIDNRLAVYARIDGQLGEVLLNTPYDYRLDIFDVFFDTAVITDIYGNSTTHDGAPIPELPPGAMQLMVLGLSGLAARFRKKRG